MINQFFSALLISFSASWILIFLSHRFHIFIDDADQEKPQNFHQYNTPRVGGIAILLGLLFLLDLPLGKVFFLSTLLAFGSGVFEDFHHTVSPKTRLFLQVITTLFSVLATHAVITYLGLGINLPYWVGLIFSVFAITGMMNAVNIIDGFNGLASGVIIFILLSFMWVTHQEHNQTLLSIVLTTLGATTGFFLINFPQGKLFLGDGGAYLLGFMVAIIGVFLASKYESVSPWYILAVFIYPVWEVIFSIARKVYMGQSPMQPDRYHLHMLIYRQITHHNPKTTLLILFLIMPFIILSTVYPNKSNTNIAVTFCFILCYLLLYRYLYHKDRSSLA